MKHPLVAGLLMVLAVAAQAVDFTYTTNLDNTITITGYDWGGPPGGAIIIPDTLNDLPVTDFGTVFQYDDSIASVTIGTNITVIGESAFESCSGLTNVTIGSNVAGIGDSAFRACSSLTGVTIPASVTAIGKEVFLDCSSLTAITVDATNPVYSSADGILIDKINARLIQCPEDKTGSVTIPGGVTIIGDGAFSYCSSLTSITIPASVTSIENYAFWGCTSLAALYFRGNAPEPGDVMFYAVSATVYYLSFTSGWGAWYGDLPTALWVQNLPQIHLGSGFGMRTNGFGFTVTGSNGTVVVEACTNLANGNWKALQTNTLSGGSFLFRDPQSTNYPRRFYRLRIP